DGHRTAAVPDTLPLRKFIASPWGKPGSSFANLGIYPFVPWRCQTSLEIKSMSENVALRPAAPADIPAIHAIYAHHVLKGLASFEEEPPSQDELLRRYREVTGGGLPYIVAELGGALAGYGYCALYRTRSAYRFAR